MRAAHRVLRAGVAAADVAALLAAVVALAWGLWWTLLAVVAIPRPARRRHAPHYRWHIAVLVPAHDEAEGIRQTVESLQGAAAHFRGTVETIVIADNCVDETASIAADAGATVLERRDDLHRGKGFALEFAIAMLAQREEQPDAVVVVDADSIVSPAFFDVIAGRHEDGARVIQVHNTVAPGGGEISRLRRLQSMLMQWARPLGARRLGLGTWLKGNGMSLRWDLARRVLGGGDIVEDVSSTLTLAEMGVCVEFEPHAEVWSEMPANYAAARTQEERWEHGRARSAIRSARTSLRALLRGRRACAAAAAELAAPPLTVHAAIACLAATWGLARGRHRLVFMAAPFSVVAYVIAGLIAARARPSDLAALRFVPRFLAHKLAVYLAFARGRGVRGWTRTERQAVTAVPRERKAS